MAVRLQSNDVDVKFQVASCANVSIQQIRHLVLHCATVASANGYLMAGANLVVAGAEERARDVIDQVCQVISQS